MVDALNVRADSDEDGNNGVLKNIKGNTELSFASGDELPSGTNRVVGSYSFNQRNKVYYFVWNSNDDHSIYQVDTSGVTLVVRGSFLELESTSILHVSGIEDTNGEIILYFTDGVTEPKKINIDKCLDPAITYPAGSTDAEKLIEVTIAKQPPLEPIEWEFKTDDSTATNNIYENMFQFAYQYVYRDGEISAISPISKVAYNSWMAKRATIKPPYKSTDNYIKLTMKTSTESVEKVRVLVRNNNIDTFALVSEIDVASPGNDLEFDFYNDGLYPLIATAESDKNYDLIPKTAQSLTISNNRLFLGNYKEGFDYFLPANINLKSHYLSTPQDKSLALTNVNAKNLKIDLSTLPDLIEGNTEVYVKIQMNYSGYDMASQSGLYTFDVVDGTSIKEYELVVLNLYPGTINFDKKIALPNAQYTKEEFGQAIASSILSFSSIVKEVTYDPLNPSEVRVNSQQSSNFTANFIGELTFDITSSTYDTVNEEINIGIDVTSLETEAVYISDPVFGFDSAERIIDNDVEGVGSLSGSLDADSYFEIPVSPNQVSTFKSNADHSFGIVYYDNRGRATGVREIGSVNISQWGDASRKGKNGAAKVIVDIPTDAPSYAESFGIVYAKNNRYSSYKQYTVMEAFKATNDENEEVGDVDGNENIYVSLASIQSKEDSYSSSKAKDFKFNVGEGDRLRIVRYYDRTLGQYVYPQDYEFDVVGIKTFTSSDSPIHFNPDIDAVNTAEVIKANKYRVSGDFLVLKNEEYEGFNHGVLGTASIPGSDLWHDGVLVEVYSPKKNTEEKIYYEIGYNFKVEGGKHVGNISTAGGTGSLDVLSQTTDSITVATVALLPFQNGDYITFKSNPGVQYQINSIVYGDTTATIYFVTSIPAGQTTIDYTSSVTRILIDEGDSYLVPKELRMYDVTQTFAPTNFDTKVYESGYVEASELSDYFDSAVFSYGKPYAIIENEREVTRKASVTYSDPYTQSSPRLTLSSFTPSFVPYYDFDVSKGGIYGLVDMKGYIMGLQEDSVMKIPVGANILDSASGDNIPTISTNVLARPMEYQGVFGINTQRDAFISFEGAVFLCDVYRGKVYRVTSQAVAEISDTGMSSYFNKKFAEYKDYESDTNKIFIKLGFDRDNDELIVSGVKYNGSTFTDDFTAGFNFRRDVWTSFYSFVGEGYAELNNVLYSFKDGKAYSHNTNSVRNRFYNTTYTSKIEIVSNQNPSMVKSWNAINLEADYPWNFTAYTSDQESSTVISMDERERLFYAHIPRDISTSSTSHFVVLGEVTAIDSLTNEVTIGNPINKMPVSPGDAVLQNGTQVGEDVSALTGRNKIKMTDATVLSGTGVTLSVQKNSNLEGDQLRDRYVKLVLENTATTPIELFAVGVVYERSRLHNDLVN